MGKKLCKIEKIKMSYPALNMMGYFKSYHFCDYFLTPICYPLNKSFIHVLAKTHSYEITPTFGPLITDGKFYSLRALLIWQRRKRMRIRDVGTRKAFCNGATSWPRVRFETESQL